MANKSPSGARNKKTSTSPVEYKVKPKPSPGAGHTPAGVDYSDDEWKQIITEWVALEDVERGPEDPSLTKDRNAMADYYQRNYITILKHGRAFGMIAEPIRRKPRKAAAAAKKRSPKVSEDAPAEPSRRGRPKAESKPLAAPEAADAPPAEATHIQPVLSSEMTEKDMRELVLLRKVVDVAVASGKLNPRDIIDLLT